MINFELKYKSALCTATTAYACAKEKNNKEIVQFLELIFPELKESEDERIRKEMLNVFKQLDEGTTILGRKYDYTKWIAWLEKQGEKEKTPCDRCRKEQPSHSCQDITSLGRCYMEGEQKPTDEFKPKFKVGDFIVHNNSGDVCQVTEIKDDKYCIWPLYAKVEGYLSFIDVDNDYYLWTIQDAKDGDVLCYDNGWTCIFKRLNTNTFSSYCFMDCSKWFCKRGCECHSLSEKLCGKIHPATKEQRDLIFEKMKESGYEWDASEKKLVKLP